MNNPTSSVIKKKFSHQQNILTNLKIKLTIINVKKNVCNNFNYNQLTQREGYTRIVNTKKSLIAFLINTCKRMVLHNLVIGTKL